MGKVNTNNNTDRFTKSSLKAWWGGVGLGFPKAPHGSPC